jgi:mxaJ protein
MYFRFLRLMCILATTLSAFAVGVPQQKLRVCADPNNLPYSNEKGEGFENKLAEMLARDLNRDVAYTWWAQRRGFFRLTLSAKQCDVVIGVPEDTERALTTRPYYRSTYVFVTRRDSGLSIHSMNDSRLHKLRVGVQIIGDDYNNSPPATSLSRRGVVKNVVGYTVYGNYADRSPTARIVEAVANKQVDVAIVWGPQAGYFASKQNVPLRITPVSPSKDGAVPFTFAISMGVRKDDRTLRDQLNAWLARHRGEIDALLSQYHVPSLTLGHAHVQRTEAAQ